MLNQTFSNTVLAKLFAIFKLLFKHCGMEHQAIVFTRFSRATPLKAVSHVGVRGRQSRDS